MNTSQKISLILGVLLFGSVVLAASRPVPQIPECVTAEQVLQHMDNSRNGVSLTCNEQVRQRNLERAGASSN